MKPHYFDNAATTPVDPRVAAVMADCLTQSGCFGNPASQHVYGRDARERVEQAREQIAAYLHAEPSEIIWTSGATESNNLAIKGAAHLYQRKGRHIVTMQTEHKSVLDTCQHLEKEGFQVTYLSPEPDGLLSMEKLQSALRDDTILVSIMQVNNETGIVQDIDAIGNLISSKGILLHVDAVQSVGKMPINVNQTPADLISLSAHKVYGPKGIGALYLRKKPRVRVEPLIHGGGHEQGMRSGTLATHQIAGMGEAYSLAQQEMPAEITRIQSLRNQLIEGLKPVEAVKFNVDLAHTVPHILSLRFDNMMADAILAQLPGIAASTSSACQGKGTEGSYVLRAMGMSDQAVKSSIRFSLGRFTTEEEISYLINQLQKIFHI